MFYVLKVLRKGVYVEKDEAGNPIGARDEATDIEWKDGCSLLVREIKARAGGKKVKYVCGPLTPTLCLALCSSVGLHVQGKKGKKLKKASKDEEGEEEDMPHRRFRQCPSIFRFFTLAPTSAHGSGSKAGLGGCTLCGEIAVLMGVDKG